MSVAELHREQPLLSRRFHLWIAAGAVVVACVVCGLAWYALHTIRTHMRADLRGTLRTVLATAAEGARTVADDELGRILERGRIGETGETYAFDSHGRMMTAGRFGRRPTDGGRPAPGSPSSVLLPLRDPGGELAAGYVPTHPPAEWPLTRMAAAATQGRSGVDLDGYRNYLGTPVVGAWLWDANLHAGLATEIAVTEAYGAYFAVRRVTVSAAATVLALCLGVPLLFWRGRTRALAATALLGKGEQALAQAQAMAHLSNWEWDVETDTLRGSEEFYRILGLDPHTTAIPMQSFIDLLHPDDRAAFGARLRLLRGGGRRDGIDVRLILPDGNERTVFALAETITQQHEQVKTITGILQDITARQSAQAALRASEDRYRRLVEDAPLGIFACDREGRILTVNAQLARMLGAPDAEQVMARNAFETPKLAETGIADLLRQCLAEGRQLEAEFAYTSTWGVTTNQRVYVAPITDDAGTLTGVQALVEDISAQKQAEAAIREGELRWRSLVDQAPVGVIVCDRDGNVLEVNAYTLERVGAPSAEIFAKQVNLLTDDGLAQAGATAHVRRCIEEGEPSSFDLRMRATFGPAHEKNIVFRCYLTPLRDATGAITGVVTVAEDVSVRRAAEDALRDSERRLAKAQELAQLGNCTLEAGSEMFDWSEEVYRICGVTREAFVPTVSAFLELVHPADREGVRANLEEALRDGRSCTAEFRLTRPDGTERIVQNRGEVTCNAAGQFERIVGTMQDITELRLVEAERMMLATAVEQAAEMILITDADGLIEYVNPAFERITGYTRAEALGKTPRLVKSGKHGPEFYRHLWKTLNAGEVWAGNFVNQRKDGTQYQEEAVISPVRNEQGEVVRFVKVMRDVTQERALEGQLRQAQKMEAIGTLAGGIAHDFNNILTAIIGFGELGAQSALNEDTKESLKEVLIASQRAKTLVHQILALSRQSDIARQPVDLVPLVKEVLRLLRAALPSTIDVRMDLPAEAIVEADPSELHQVLMNLGTNAGQAMADGGVLHVGVQLLELTAADCGDPLDVRPGAYACLTIRDSGCGMDSATLARIFEPYYTTKPVGEGTGLGLAVVHGIVKSLDGDVEVASTPGAGSVFHVYLPLSRDGVTAGTAGTVVTAGHEHVLFVDDEPQIRTMMRTALERQGYQVRVCADGVDALTHLRETRDQVAIVVTDRTMPRMTGIDLVREVREQWPELPVVLCTGFGDGELVTRAEALGVAELLRKPVSGTELGVVIRRVLDGRTPAAAATDDRRD